MNRPPFLLVVLFTLATFLSGALAAFEWRCEVTDMDSGSTSFKPCPTTCDCTTGLTAVEDEIVCYDTTLNNIAASETSCEQPRPDDAPCTPAFNSCEWTCRHDISAAPVLCSLEEGWTTCNCDNPFTAIETTVSVCSVKIDGSPNYTEDPRYCKGPAPTTRPCTACDVQWLCVESDHLQTGANPIACDDAQCACQTGTVTFATGVPVCFANGTIVTEDQLMNDVDAAAACETLDSPSDLVECDENSCQWKCTASGAKDAAIVECDPDSDIFPPCSVPNNCGVSEVEANVLCVDEKNQPVVAEACAATERPTMNTTLECNTFSGCGSWQCLPPNQHHETPKACEKVCGVGCGNGNEKFVYGTPHCVVRGPGGLVHFVKVGEEEAQFCPSENPNSKKPVLTECTETDDCAMYCRAPSAPPSVEPAPCSTSALEQWGPCDAPDACGTGEAITSFVCYDERISMVANMDTCTSSNTTAPVDEVSECSIYTGCGTWECLSEDGVRGPCNIVCPVGCGTSHEIFTNGSPVCVYKGFIVSDPDEAARWCPENSPISPKPVLKECTQISRCAYYCQHPSASSQGAPEGAMVPCDDNSAWTACDAPDMCGSGRANTTVACYDTLAGTPADQANCDRASVSPVSETRSCTEFSGCGVWRCRPEGDSTFAICDPQCPEGCGPATEVLNGEPTCVKSINGEWIDVGPDQCPSANVEERLPLPQPCNATSSCEWLCMLRNQDGDWDRSTLRGCTDTQWSSCSVTCGFGSKERDVGCYGPAPPESGNIRPEMEEHFCSAKPADEEGSNERPDASTTCEEHSTCIFSWKCAKHGTTEYVNCEDQNTWSVCSASCGQGKSTRAVACHDQNNGMRDSNYCTGTRPLDERECSGTDCSYVWGCHDGSPHRGECSGEDAVWGPCSATCGEGEKERTVSCFTSIKSGEFVLEPDSRKCTGTAPARRASCTFTSGCEWDYTEWSTCQCKGSVGASDPVTERRAVCHDAFGNESNYADCKKNRGDPQLVRPCTGAPVCTDGMAPAWYAPTGEAAWSECVGRCEWGVQTRLVDCRFVPVGSEPSESYDVIGNDFCRGLTRPSEWRRCDIAAGCNHAPAGSNFMTGVCVSGPATRSDNTPLSAELNATQGVCECMNGYQGVLCEIESIIADVTIMPKSSDQFYPGSDIEVGWRAETNKTLPISITIRRAQGRSPVVTTIMLDIPSYAAPVVTRLPNGLPVGDYLLRVHISEVIYAETTFTVVPACSGQGSNNKPRCNDGTCNPVSGKCECPQGFTGEFCEKDMCSDAQCNIVGTKSCNPTTGACVCNDDYVAGSLRCLTPKSCENTGLSCSNGGALILGEGGTCNSCFCHPPWSGSTCNVCSLECHKGIQKDCKECECSLGFTHDTAGKCTCRFIEMKFAYRLDATPLASGNEADVRAWRLSLEWDLNMILNGKNPDKPFEARFVGETRVTSGGVRYTTVSLVVRAWCDPRFSFKNAEYGVVTGGKFMSYDEIYASLLSRAESASEEEQEYIFTTLADLSSNDLVMFDAYEIANKFKTAFADRHINPESTLASAHAPAGIGMYDPGCSSGNACIKSLGNGGVMIPDPDIPDTSGSEKTGSGLSTTDLIIVICAVVGGVILLVIIFVVLARCNNWCCFASVERPSQRASASSHGATSYDTRRRMNINGGQNGRAGRSRKKPSTQWDPRDDDMPRTPWNI